MKKLFWALIFILTACSNINKNANYFFIKGLSEYQKGNKTFALENYEKAYKLDSNNIKIVRELGFIYADLGNLEKAKEYYNKALKIRDYDENAIESLLEIAYLEEDYTAVEKYSKQILDKNSLLYNRSQMKIALHKKDYEKAKYYYQKVLELEK